MISVKSLRTNSHLVSEEAMESEGETENEEEENDKEFPKCPQDVREHHHVDACKKQKTIKG